MFHVHSTSISVLHRRPTFLKGLLPPPNSSGSTVLKPLAFLLLSLGAGLCSSITSTISSSCCLAGLLVSSMTTVSLLLSLLGGGVLSRVLLTSITSLADGVEGGLRGDDLRGDDSRLLRDRECRRMTSSSTTADELAGAPRPKHVYMSQSKRRKPATEPKTMPTTVPGVGPSLIPA